MVSRNAAETPLRSTSLVAILIQYMVEDMVDVRSPTIGVSSLVRGNFGAMSEAKRPAQEDARTVRRAVLWGTEDATANHDRLRTIP